MKIRTISSIALKVMSMRFTTDTIKERDTSPLYNPSTSPTTFIASIHNYPDISIHCVTRKDCYLSPASHSYPSLPIPPPFLTSTAKTRVDIRSRPVHSRARQARSVDLDDIAEEYWACGGIPPPPLLLQVVVCIVPHRGWGGSNGCVGPTPELCVMAKQAGRGGYVILP